MTKNQIIAEHVIVTFFEALGAYLIVNQTSLTGNWRGAAIGAVGFALSVAYNVLRQSVPTIPTLPPAGDIGEPSTPTTPVLLPTEAGQGSGADTLPNGNPLPGQPG